MKKIITILLISFSTILFSQEDITMAEMNENKVTSLIFSVDSTDELKSINWVDVKEIFKNNKDENEKVVLGFKVKDNKSNSKLKFKHSFEVKGKLSDLDGTIEMAKKMIKIIETYKNK